MNDIKGFQYKFVVVSVRLVGLRCVFCLFLNSNKWKMIVLFFLSISSRFFMAASWLRIHELANSYADLVCIVARIQSINSSQRTLILYEDHEENKTSSTLHISFVNLRTPINIQSSAFSAGQYVQIYGKVIRQGGNIIRIDAQFIRLLGIDFDMKEYINGLILTRNYMTNINGENVVDIKKSCLRMGQSKQMS